PHVPPLLAPRPEEPLLPANARRLHDREGDRRPGRGRRDGLGRGRRVLGRRRGARGRVRGVPVIVSSLGFPRIGPRRELKHALERHWAGKLDAAELRDAALGLRTATWTGQRALGVTHVPSNDFSFYDHVLDTAVMVG